MKFGQLFLDGGKWQGRQIVSKEWLESWVKPRSGLNKEGDYGYGWHLADYDVGGKTYSAISASGNGGQLFNRHPGPGTGDHIYSWELWQLRHLEEFP